MIHFEPLASSSAGCAYRVSCGSHSILLDAGMTIKSLQIALGFRISALSGCLLSHAHGDHSRAIYALMEKGLDVYAHEGTWSSIASTKQVSQVRKKVVTADQRFSVGAWTVSAFEAVHDCPGTLGFVIDSPEGDRLLYLTDSVYSKVTFPGLTHLAVECNHSIEIVRRNVDLGFLDKERATRTLQTHMSIERLEDLLRANDLSRVESIWLLHLSNGNSNEAEFKNRIVKLTGVPVHVAAERGNS